MGRGAWAAPVPWLVLSLAAPPAPVAAQAPAARVEVRLERTEVTAHDTVQARASVFDASGAPVPDARVVWVASTPELASVARDGTVVALNPGTAKVTAVVGGRSGSALLTIRELPAARLEVRLRETRPFAGQAVPLDVRAWNRLDERVAVPALTFESDDTSVVWVDAGGLAFARAPGAATVTVRGGAAEPARVHFRVRADPGLRYVLEPEGARVRTGDVVRFRVRAEGPDGAGQAYAAWSVGGAGAQVETEGGEGVFVAEEPGTYRVTARIGEREVRSAIVTVEPRAADAELVLVGRGPIAGHHSGDVWVFEGLDGRDYAYIGTFMYDWMKVWDVTDPERPVLTDSLHFDARRINDVKIHPRAHLGVVTREGASNRRNGLVILDLSEPAHPTVLSEYTETLTGGVHNVWIDGEHELVYAVHNGTRAVHIIDIADPTRPTEVGRWGIDNQQRSLHDIIVQDGYAYVSYWDDGAVILDVGAGTHGGTPRRPAFVSRYRYPIGNTHVAWRHGKYLFVGDEIFPPGWNPDGRIDARGYIHVLDLTDIENPVEVARYEVPEAGAHNVWAEGDRLYVGYYQAGLRVLDISGELRGDLYRQGREIARILTTDEDTTTPNWPMAWGAQIHKGRIYSSDLNSGLWITRLVERSRPISQ